MKNNTRRAIAALRDHALEKGISAEIASAIGDVLDHITRVEQTLTLILVAVRSADRDRPTFAIMPEPKP